MNLHPLIHDPIESERCPDCGAPGIVIRRPAPGLQELACPACDPERCRGAA